jgi:hypothetical protein
LIRKRTDLLWSAFSSTYRRCICFHLLLHFLISIIILLADEAVARKQFVAGKGAFGKDGGKGKGDVAMNFLMFFLCLHVFLH